MQYATVKSGFLPTENHEVLVSLFAKKASHLSRPRVSVYILRVSPSEPFLTQAQMASEDQVDVDLQDRTPSLFSFLVPLEESEGSA